MIADRQLSSVHRALRAYFRSGWAFLILCRATARTYTGLVVNQQRCMPGDGPDKYRVGSDQQRCYLAAYLLYAGRPGPDIYRVGSEPTTVHAWLLWPANPSTDLLSTVTPSTAYRPLSSVFRPPCLLHVYWFLHALQLLLGGLALRTWWQASALKLQLSAYVSDGNTSENVGQTHVTRARGNSAASTGAHSACPPSSVCRATNF